MSELDKEYEASLKSIETENKIDRIFYRPIGFRIARMLRGTGITPNMITVISIFVGAAVGFMFYHDNLTYNICGILLLVFANILDCVDGQLARLTGIKSAIGRILDGFAGDIWFASIYIGFALRLSHDYGTDWFFALAVLSGLSHLVQANITDYYKTLHLYFISKDKGSEFQSLEQVEAKHKEMKYGINKFFYFLYRWYTMLQVKATPTLQSMLQNLHAKYGDNIPVNISEKLANKYASGKINSAIIENCVETELRKYEQAILRLEKETPIYFNQEGSLDYISIAIERYPFAISCDGKYYKRSGSTLRELQGFELQSFLLERAGKTWDSVPIPGVSIEDLDKNALNAFRSKAVKSKRMSEQDVVVSDALLLRNLKLLDGDYLTRAAILLFHPDPEQYVTGAYLKIAFFASAGVYGQNEDADIIYQDDIHGPLITQADKADSS